MVSRKKRVSRKKTAMKKPRTVMIRLTRTLK